MKSHIHKLATYTALILISSMPFSLEVLADTEKKTNTSSVSSEKTAPIGSKQKLLAEKNQQIVEEAKGSLAGTQQALLALEKNDAKTARSILQDVLTKLDILLTEHPAAGLVTADIEADIYDFDGDSKTLEKRIKEADDLLDGGKLQSARQLLAELASEMRITTVNIPLATYPTAIKDAIAKIDADKKDEAAQALNDVLNTLVEETEIIPLPILRAEALLTKASELEHKEDMSKESVRTEILKYADAAKEKLKIAQLLGYGSKEDYQPLYTVIDDIKNVVHTKKSEATWDKIKKSFGDLKNKIAHPLKPANPKS